MSGHPGSRTPSPPVMRKARHRSLACAHRAAEMRPRGETAVTRAGPTYSGCSKRLPSSVERVVVDSHLDGRVHPRVDRLLQQVLWECV